MQEPWADRPCTGSTTSATAKPVDRPMDPESASGGGDDDNSGISSASVQKLVSENAVIVFGRRGCCMAHVVKRLLLALGANPPVFEVDGEAEEARLLGEFAVIVGEANSNEEVPQFPVVFVGGKLLGGLERVMATHISGELVPILRQAGALWL
ncbi:hypothetical protein Nepgr_017661 [Nepenthes gracilis]|uniref:Glutaredoxin domain-containing protein n=1 Tax=Nepenthes gracilis TaxID=150966 RepID=A0AAD3SRV0_NEPGR|nr:hypothetical protein Nepgr_017661 [Nepenthes gracilis]